MLKSIDKLPYSISFHVLSLGPDYRNHRGGIGAVIEIYSKYFEKFNFVPTYKVGSNFYKIFIFAVSIGKLFQRLITDTDIKIVHIHGASYASFYRKFICFVISKYFFKKKVIYHIHGAEYYLFYSKSERITKRLIHLFVDKADVVICLSESWMKFFKENFTINKISIMPNIVDYPKYMDRDYVTHLIRFLFLGYIGQRKGIFDVVEVVKNNIKEFRNKIEIIIGGNGETDELIKRINDYEIGEIVRFVGWVQHDEKNNYLRNSDVYILSSYNEGLPISILEAMSYGKPIISTNVGGIPEIVKNGVNGILIEPGNLREIKEALNFFIENRHKIVEYGKKSSVYIERYYPHSVMSELQDVYKNLLKDE